MKVEALNPQLDELKKELKEKEADLKEIIKANEKEEAKLRAQRKEIEAQKKARLFRLYENQESKKRKSSCNNKKIGLFRMP